MNKSDELHSYLRKIAEKSKNGEIDWTQPNPSTFNWRQSANGDNYLVKIQKARNPKYKFIDNEKESVLMFQVNSSKTRQTLISLSTTERPEFYDVLTEIFKGAEMGIDIRSSRVLEKLLRP